MSYVLLLVLFLWSPHLRAVHVSVVSRCRLQLIRDAQNAKSRNAEMVIHYFRSPDFIDGGQDPSDFWHLAKKDPRAFLLGATDRLEKAADMAPHYTEILNLLNDGVLTPTVAEKIATLESDPFFNRILDEYETLQNFDFYAQSKFRGTVLLNYQNVKQMFMTTIAEVIKLRQQLRARLQPTKLSASNRKMLLDAWLGKDYSSDLHPDTLSDWLTGADAALGEDEIFIDPKSGHQIGYGAAPLSIVKKSLAEIPLNPGDTILDVGSGWGRIVMSGAITHPQFNFAGVEFVSQRANYVQGQIAKLDLRNARSFQGDASAPLIEKEIAQAKVLFLFNALSKPALELFLARVKDVVQRGGEKKYIVTVNEQGFPFKLSSRGFKIFKQNLDTKQNFNSFKIYEINR